MKKLILSLALLATFASGCASSRGDLTRTADAELAVKPAVEVWLDAEPEQPFHVVSELTADTLESPRSIAAMKAEAGRRGLDGIYWIECAGRGVCRAKGFVYTAFGSASAKSDVASMR